MADLIQIKDRRQPTPAPEPRIFVCNCGCSSFELYDDHTTACALCGASPVSPELPRGAWETMDAAPARAPDASERVRQVGGNGDAEFAKRLLQRRAEMQDVVNIIVIREDGTIHMWADFETEKQRAWMKRRLNDARKMLDDLQVPE